MKKALVLALLVGCGQAEAQEISDLEAYGNKPVDYYATAEIQNNGAGGIALDGPTGAGTLIVPLFLSGRMRLRQVALLAKCNSGADSTIHAAIYRYTADAWNNVRTRNTGRTPRFELVKAAENNIVLPSGGGTQEYFAQFPDLELRPNIDYALVVQSSDTANTYAGVGGGFTIHRTRVILPAVSNPSVFPTDLSPNSTEVGILAAILSSPAAMAMNAELP